MVSIDASLCNACRVCTWVCPHGVLEMADKTAIVARGDDCIECGACRLNCVTGAVSVTKGTGCLLVIVREDILGRKKETACCG